jgi:ABC-type spermidine/putrescine transport system permease subunit II
MNTDQKSDSQVNTIIKRSRRTITEFRYYEVTEDELAQLEQAVTDSTDKLAFATTALGVFVSTLCSMISTDREQAFEKWLTFLVFVISSGVVALNQGLAYIRGKREIKRLMSKLRDSESIIRPPVTVVDPELSGSGD